MIGNNGINGAIKQGIEKVRDLGDAVAADAAAAFGEAAEAAEQQGCGGEDPGSGAEARYVASRLGAIRIVESEK